MLWSTQDIRRFTLAARDGEIGSVADVYFDDRTWRIRYLVADTRRWLPGRKVLLSPQCLGTPEEKSGSIPADLSVEQIKSAPSIAEDRPVSREMEREIYRHFGWTPYWTGLDTLGAAGAQAAAGGAAPAPPPPEEPEASALRSANEVRGYAAHAREGRIGGVAALLADRDWAIRYLVIDRGVAGEARPVLVPASEDADIRWAGQLVEIDAALAEIENSPALDADAPVERSFEELLHRHYGHTPYWL